MPNLGRFKYIAILYLQFGLCVSQSLAPPPAITKVSCQVGALVCGDTAILRSMDHLHSHEAAESSITAAGRALPDLSSMVHSFVITTPTKSHSHKSKYLLRSFTCDAVGTRKVRKSKVPAKYCSITVSSSHVEDTCMQGQNK